MYLFTTVHKYGDINCAIINALVLKFNSLIVIDCTNKIRYLFFIFSHFRILMLLYYQEVYLIWCYMSSSKSSSIKINALIVHSCTVLLFGTIRYAIMTGLHTSPVANNIADNDAVRHIGRVPFDPEVV